MILNSIIMKYRVVRVDREDYEIYKYQIFGIFKFVHRTPSFSLARKWCRDQGEDEFEYIERWRP